MTQMENYAPASEIISRLHRAGFLAYLVGGCVRDLLLHRQPKDFDVATNARPRQVLALFPGSNLVGAHFGVVIVGPIEVATFRSDHDYKDGRHPTTVSFEADPRLDALRRDFTINALFLDTQTDTILDFANGQSDLANRIVRAIGNPESRFQEDHLRLLRAVRFAARLNFEIEPETLHAMRLLAPLITRVSAERIQGELTRILTEGNARRGFELLEETHLLPHILPEISALRGVQQPPEYHPEGDVWVHTMMMLEGLQSPSPALALGVLLHDVGKPPTFRVADRIRFDGHAETGARMTREILNRLRYSNETVDHATSLVANHMKFIDVPKMRESTLKRFLRLPDFAEHMALHRLDCLNSHGNLETYRFIERKIRETPPEILRPPPLLTGRDLIAEGFPPGPRFSHVLATVEDAQLESRVSTKAEALALARTLFNDPDPLSAL